VSFRARVGATTRATARTASAMQQALAHRHARVLGHDRRRPEFHQARQDGDFEAVIAKLKEALQAARIHSARSRRTG